MPRFRRRARRGGRRLRAVRRGRNRAWNRIRVPGVHAFKETYTKGVTTQLAGTTGAGRIATSLGELQNSNQFNGLFDMFKITGMKVKLIPKINSNNNYTSQSGVQVQNNLPMLYIAPNRDPYIPNPTSAADVLNDDGARAIRFDRPITLWLSSPKPDVKLYSAADGSLVGPVMGQLGIGSKYQMWFPTNGNNSSVAQATTMFWYGFRYWIDNLDSGSDLKYEIIVTQYSKFKEQD